VLYGAAERKTAFLETLQSYRPALPDLARLQESTSSAEVPLATEALGLIPAAYFAARRIAAFRLASAARCIDLRSVETHAVLRVLLAGDLMTAGYDGAFNFGEIIGVDYVVTQRIARWAYSEGYDGIVYASTHDPALICWAIFDCAEIVQLGTPELIHRDDPDFLAAAELFGLAVPD
jgi:hypothetical protein